MIKKFGLIAEGESDIAVIKEIFIKIFKKNGFSIMARPGKGSGNIINKCRSWTNDLLKNGCDYVFIFHDLDNNDCRELRKKLQDRISKKEYPNAFIIIPVQEIEAWLLSDPAAIKQVFNLQSLPNIKSDVESIDSPKEHLGKLIRKHKEGRYLNRTHNAKIAKAASINSFKKCKSFMKFLDCIDKITKA